MAKKNRSRNDSEFEENDDRDDVIYTGSPFQGLPETHLQSSALLDEILMNYPHPDSRARQYLMLLRHQLETDDTQFEEAQQALQEFEEVYNKLTQPANRIGVYIRQIARRRQAEKQQAQAAVSIAAARQAERKPPDRGWRSGIHRRRRPEARRHRFRGRHARQSQRSLCHRRRSRPGHQWPDCQNQRSAGR